MAMTKSKRRINTFSVLVALLFILRFIYVCFRWQCYLQSLFTIPKFRSALLQVKSLFI